MTSPPRTSPNGGDMACGGAFSTPAPYQDTPQPVPDVLLTPEEVAAWLHVEVRWVRRHAVRGTLPSVKLGAYRRFRRWEIEKWLEDQRA